MNSLHKQAEISDTLKAVGTLTLPLVANEALSAAMGPGAYTEVTDPHSPFKSKTLQYTPVAEATERVRQGKGSMLDHMQAYRHPLQPQANPAYAIGHRLGPKMLSGVSGASDFLWGHGYGQSGLAGAATGSVLSLLANALLRAQGRSEMPYWQAALLGAGAGGLAGLGGSYHRQYYQNKFPKLTTQLGPRPVMEKPAAWRSPDMDERAAQASIQSVLSMVRSAPGLSFNQRAQLMSGVGSLDANSARELQRLLMTSGGAAIGAIVARFLMGKGLGSTVLGAMLGGFMGNALFGNNASRTSTGRPAMTGIDFSGRRF